MAERMGDSQRPRDASPHAAARVGGRPPRFVMLLGGFHPPSRLTEMADGTRPSNDVRVLVDRFGADVLDFGWLEARAERSRRMRLLVWLARRTGQWSAALAIASAGAVRAYDVVYVSGEDVAVWACAASRLRRGRAPMFVVRIERPVYGRTRARRLVHRRMFALAAPRIDVALCRTASHAAYLRANTSVTGERALPFGQEIDTEFFKPEQERSEPVSVEGPYILSAGLERRDYGTLLDAVDGLPITLVIAAGSPWSKDRFNTDRELPDNVVVGSFDHGQMRELYRNARAVVASIFPTDRACGMNVIGEAWAMGRPVVASATTGLREFIGSGDNGLLVPPGDSVALRAAIESVLQSDELARQLGERGREYVRTRLSLDQFGATVDRAIGIERA